jgi:hypothetical protein
MRLLDLFETEVKYQDWRFIHQISSNYTRLSLLYQTPLHDIQYLLNTYQSYPNTSHYINRQSSVVPHVTLAISCGYPLEILKRLIDLGSLYHSEISLPYIGFNADFERILVFLVNRGVDLDSFYGISKSRHVLLDAFKFNHTHLLNRVLFLLLRHGVHIEPVQPHLTYSQSQLIMKLRMRVRMDQIMQVSYVMFQKQKLDTLILPTFLSFLY